MWEFTDTAQNWWSICRNNFEIQQCKFGFIVYQTDPKKTLKIKLINGSRQAVFSSWNILYSTKKVKCSNAPCNSNNAAKILSVIILLYSKSSVENLEFLICS